MAEFWAQCWASRVKTRSKSNQDLLAATRCGAERGAKASYRKDGFEKIRCAKRAQSSKQDDREIEVQGRSWYQLWYSARGRMCFRKPSRKDFLCTWDWTRESCKTNTLPRAAMLTINCAKVCSCSKHYNETPYRENFVRYVCQFQFAMLLYAHCST